MNNREFFNSLAYKWDEMCHHDDKKIRKILYFCEGGRLPGRFFRRGSSDSSL